MTRGLRQDIEPRTQTPGGVSKEFYPRPVPGGATPLRIWMELRSEAGGGFGPAPVRRQDVSEWLDAEGIRDASERQRLRKLVRCVDEGYHAGHRKPDKADEKKQEAKDGQDALSHFRAEYRKSHRSA